MAGIKPEAVGLDPLFQGLLFGRGWLPSVGGGR